MVFAPSSLRAGSTQTALDYEGALVFPGATLGPGLSLPLRRPPLAPKQAQQWPPLPPPPPQQQQQWPPPPQQQWPQQQQQQWQPQREPKSHRPAPRYAATAAPAYRAAPTCATTAPSPAPSPKPSAAPPAFAAAAPASDAAPAPRGFQHRAAPSASASTSVATSQPVRVPPEPPRRVPTERALPASALVREMGYTVQREVERMVGVRFLKFDVVSYVTESVRTNAPSVDDRVAHAAELSASQRGRDQARGRDERSGPPPAPMQAWASATDAPAAAAVGSCYLDSSLEPPDYLRLLRSHAPRGRAIVYFLKVDAAWCGGFAHMHLRVRHEPRAQPAAMRADAGATAHAAAAADGGGGASAVKGTRENRSALQIFSTPEDHCQLEGVLTNMARHTPLETFAPTYHRHVLAPHDHRARLARTGTFF